MTESETIERILYMGVGRSGLANENSCIAKALKEVQQYRAIDTVDNLAKLKERHEKAKWLLDEERKQRRLLEEEVKLLKKQLAHEEETFDLGVQKSIEIVKIR